MKRFLILLIVMKFTGDLHSQVGLFQALSMDFSTGYYTSKTWNQWRDHYNTVNAAELKKGMGRFFPSAGFEVGYNLCIVSNAVSWYSPIRYNYGRATATAKFNDGTARHMQLEKRTFYLPIGLGGFNASGSGFGGFFVSIPVGMSYYRINAAYEYRDGTISYGGDKALNGIYRSRDGKIGLDLTAMGGTGRLGIIAHATFLMSMLPPDITVFEMKGMSGTLSTPSAAVSSKFREFTCGIGLMYALN